MQTRRLGNSDLQITPIGFGAWALGGGGWAFGWARRTIANRLPRFARRSTSASTGSIPPRFTGSVIPRRSWRRRSKACTIVRTFSPSAPNLGRGEANWEIAQSRLDSPGVRGKPQTAKGRTNRVVSNALAGTRRGSRGRLEHDGETPGTGQSSLDRRVEFQCPAVETSAGDRRNHVTAAALLDGSPRHRSGNPALLRVAKHRRHRLLADAIGAAYRENDTRAHRRHAGRRLAAREKQALSGTAVNPKSQHGRVTQGNREAARPLGGRSRDRLGAATAGRDRRDCRRGGRASSAS